MKIKFIRWLFVIMMLGGVVLNILAYRHAYAMMHFTAGNPRTNEPEKLSVGQRIKALLWGVNIPRPETTALPAVLGPATQSLQLECINGMELGAWYCAGPSQSPLVILFHGYGCEKSSLIPEAKAFLTMGFSVLLVDFRGSGDSSGSYTTIGFTEAKDVATAVHHARMRLPQCKLILYGGSMGAAAILRAVASCDIHPDAIIVESVFDKMLNTVRHRFAAMRVPAFPSAELLVFWGGYQARFNGFAHNPSRYAASVECPILFLHGANDPRVKVEEARRVYDAVPGVKYFREFPGVGHEAAVVRFPNEWKRSVGQFLGKVADNRMPAAPNHTVQ
ncbi:MAG: alpha/beta fold hydrolase [Verrucomicrobiota bacterium]